jgi:pimeloyl-ACP methyl ester carboxylesterase
VIAVDRPGHGLSDFQPDRTLLDWPTDITALADALGFERFAAVGMSAGGPYVLACAYSIPDRLTTATLIAGAAPLNDPEIFKHLPRQLRATFGLARRAPWLV